MRVNLTVTAGPHTGKVYSFEEHDNFIVGRSKRAHFQLPIKDKYFSRIHFMIEVNPPQCRLMDMGSTNGTYVNGQKVDVIDLTDGDLIKGGQTIIRVSVQGPPEAEVQTVLPASVGTEPPPGQPSSILEVIPIEEPGAPAPPAARVPGQVGRPPRGEPAGIKESSGAAFVPVFESVEVAAGAAAVQHREPVASPRPLAAAATNCAVCSASLKTVNVATLSADLASLPPICAGCWAQIQTLAQPIDGYLVIRELGHGAMGMVSLAARKRDGTLVALKTIMPAVAGSRANVDRFFREASILRELDHPNIVAFREMGESNGQLFFAMDFVGGRDGARLLKDNGGPLPVKRAVDLVCQLLEALEYAHGKGFVHRDIKPANLLVTETNGREVAKLLDFGLARVYQTSQLSGLTMTGDLGGTVAFMAPEQITHYREAKPPVDQYAAGATLYNLLSDRFPYDLPRHVQQQILLVLQHPTVPIASRRKDLPRPLAEIIHRAMAREPGERFPDVGAMRQALLRFCR